MKKDGKKRVWFLLIFCTAVFAAFLVRLYWMQFTMADHYAKKLEQASQTSYTVRIPAARGSIVDRSGTALVQDDTVYDLALCVPAPPDTEMAQTLLHRSSGRRFHLAGRAKIDDWGSRPAAELQLEDAAFAD